MPQAGNKDIWNILMVGVGGQGIVLASDILATAANDAGFDSKKSEIKGMSQRGGSVFSHVRFGKKIYSPVIPEGCVDILLSLELLETLRWVSYAAKSTEFIILNEKILPANSKIYPEGIEEEICSLASKIIFIDPQTIYANEVGKKYVNVALCGMLSARLPLPETSWRDAISHHTPAGTFDDNWRAFGIGVKLKK